MRLDDINEALGLVGIVPFKPKLWREPQGQNIPQFLPGSIEARVQDAMISRGWSYRLVCVHPDVDMALIARHTAFIEEDSILLLAQYSRLLAESEQAAA